jgi:hypothetical protein
MPAGYCGLLPFNGNFCGDKYEHLLSQTKRYLLNSYVNINSPTKNLKSIRNNFTSGLPLFFCQNTFHSITLTVGTPVQIPFSNDVNTCYVFRLYAIFSSPHLKKELINIQYLWITCLKHKATTNVINKRTFTGVPTGNYILKFVYVAIINHFYKYKY